MRNVLVTGGCGFIGSNFLNYMVEKYPDVNFYNLDAMYYCASHNNINVSNLPNYEMIEGNVCDYNLVVYLLKSKSIDTIVHFAAQSHVDNSFLESFKYTEDNVKGTHVLLEATKNTNKNILFLHFSTDEVYGESNLDEDPKHESTILCPTNPYAASKAAAEMFVNSYIHSFNLRAIITRCNNVFGPNQYPEKLIPKFINHLKNGQKCTIHGDGSSLRSFIHVDDVSTAVECILTKGVVGEIYNIGSDDMNELSVLEVTHYLIEMICGTTEYDKWIEYVTDRPFNDKRYYITNKKIKQLGWEQKIVFLEGLKKLVSS
jgi:dTDP-glucose 4,6-dehydratase